MVEEYTVYSYKLYRLLYSFSTGQTPKALPQGLFKIYREVSSCCIILVRKPRGCPLDTTQHSLKWLKTLVKSGMTSAELLRCFQQAQEAYLRLNVGATGCFLKLELEYFPL